MILLYLLARADADGVPSIARAAAGARVRGVIAGFVYDRTRENLPSYLPASTEAYAYVYDDPNLAYYHAGRF